MHARNSCNCGSCGVKVCLKHRFEDQHHCQPKSCRSSAGRAAGASASAGCAMVQSCSVDLTIMFIKAPPQKWVVAIGGHESPPKLCPPECPQEQKSCEGKMGEWLLNGSWRCSRLCLVLFWGWPWPNAEGTMCQGPRAKGPCSKAPCAMYKFAFALNMRRLAQVLNQTDQHVSHTYTW